MMASIGVVPDVMGEKLDNWPHRRSSAELKIHCASIASGKSVIKNAIEIDELNEDLRGIVCFEIEGAGLMDYFPYLVNRAIYSYADSHNNDKWQKNVAAVEAANAKKFLAMISCRVVKETVAMQQTESPYIQSPPASELPSVLQPLSFSDQLLPEPQYSYF